MGFDVIMIVSHWNLTDISAALPPMCMSTHESLRMLQSSLCFIGPFSNGTSLRLVRFNSSPWWRHQMETFSALLAICAGNSPVPVNSLRKGQWRGALMFSLICTRINGWVNNGEAGDLRRNRAHYDVIVMLALDAYLNTIWSSERTDASRE